VHFTTPTQSLSKKNHKPSHNLMATKKTPLHRAKFTTKIRKKKKNQTYFLHVANTFTFSNKHDQTTTKIYTTPQ